LAVLLPYSSSNVLQFSWGDLYPIQSSAKQRASEWLCTETKSHKVAVPEKCPAFIFASEIGYEVRDCYSRVPEVFAHGSCRPTLFSQPQLNMSCIADMIGYCARAVCEYLCHLTVPTLR
jgi:hypothetical protein